MNHFLINTQNLGVCNNLLFQFLCISLDVSTPKFKRICQFSKSRLICPHGTTIRIDSAFWGRKRRDVCRYISIVDCGLNGVSNTTKKLKSICEGKQHCNIFASSHDNYYGNPCSGVFKYLEVNYTCAREGRRPIFWHFFFSLYFSLFCFIFSFRHSLVSFYIFLVFYVVFKCLFSCLVFQVFKHVLE